MQSDGLSWDMSVKEPFGQFERVRTSKTFPPGGLIAVNAPP
jgi:hypothetical protein